MDEQQAFDTAVRALKKQGRRSYDGERGCLYRAPNGDKCAIGHLLSDEEYSPNMEHRTAAMIQQGFDVLRGLSAAFLNDLQSAHDLCRTDYHDNAFDCRDFNLRFADVADMHNLNIAVLCEPWPEDAVQETVA